jgi:hypothetical protein
MKKFCIEISRKSSPDKATAEAEFDEEEVSRLRAFYEQAEALTDLSVLKMGMPGNLKISYEKDQGLTFAGSVPPSESVAALLHKLRPFILNDEHISYNRVTGLLKRRFSDTGIRSMLDKQRRIYDGREFQSQINIAANDIAVNSEQALFNWLNSFEYHNDQTKKQEISKLHELMPNDALRAIFFVQLTDKVSAILNVASFVGLLLGKVPQFETHA